MRISLMLGGKCSLVHFMDCLDNALKSCKEEKKRLASVYDLNNAILNHICIQFTCLSDMFLSEWAYLT